MSHTASQIAGAFLLSFGVFWWFCQGHFTGQVEAHGREEGSADGSSSLCLPGLFSRGVAAAQPQMAQTFQTFVPVLPRELWQSFWVGWGSPAWWHPTAAGPMPKNEFQSVGDLWFKGFPGGITVLVGNRVKVTFVFAIVIFFCIFYWFCCCGDGFWGFVVALFVA